VGPKLQSGDLLTFWAGFSRVGLKTRKESSHLSSGTGIDVVFRDGIYRVRTLVSAER
jgi:hypothetical protein